MPLEDATRGDAATKGGKIHSHRFAGGQTWLAEMRGDRIQLGADIAMLRGAASIDIAAAVGADGTRTLPADGAPVKAGEPLILDVVVRNERVGHRFPGGVLDAQDTWIEIQVHDARGRRLATSGVAHESAVDDDTAHVLRAVQVDELGIPVTMRETDRFRATAYNHTIAPRDAEVVRYRLDVPRGLEARSLPLKVTARLRHRSRNLQLSRAACLESRTARGTAFTKEVATRTEAPIDPCKTEPMTDVAESETWIGAGSSGMARSYGAPPWRRLYGHALGLLHALQENVDDARPSLERALELAPPGDERARAMLLDAAAEVANREGRTDEAMALLDRVDRLAPDRPAVAHARGQAFAGVWRWSDAASALERAAYASPVDDVLWGHLAVARGAAGNPGAALAAATHVLALGPRDADALRVQALALEALGADGQDVASARAAFARWRPPDDAPASKNACAMRSAACALERVPVHVHALTPE